MAKFQPRVQDEGRDDGLKEKMIAVNRVTKVVKDMPAGIVVQTPTQTEILIKGADRQAVGQIAA